MFRCVKTFAGNKVSMKKGDTKENLEKEIAEDLLRAGYIVEEKAKEIETEVKEPEVKAAEVVEEVAEKVAEKVEKAAAKKTTSKKKK